MRKPRLSERVIVIADNHDDVTLRTDRPAPRRTAARHRERVAPRAVAQLEHVAEQHKPIDVVERLDQCLARPWPAQHVSAGAGAEMQV